MDREVITLLKSISERPDMYLRRVDFDVAAAYLAGLDAGSGVLGGFHEWAVVRADRGDNLTWCQLALYVLYPDSPDPSQELDALEDHSEIVKVPPVVGV